MVGPADDVAVVVEEIERVKLGLVIPIRDEGAFCVIG